MYGLYEVYTWDEVDYTLISKHETQEEAEKEKARLEEERKKVFKPTERIPVDCICYTIMTDLQYYNLMH